ncbi:hypothetical protein [Streptosporangium sp. NPDC006007]|uniref:hypothetical protein n=1 Tax=Streptosporangium sp. NPDC006007 TaxID=3154575 RepID=UPI0033AFF47D
MGDYSREFYAAIDKRISDFEDLSEIDSDTIDRLRPVIFDAARSYQAQNYFPPLRAALKSKPRVKISIAAAILAALFFMINSFLPPPNLDGSGVFGALCALIALELLATIRLRQRHRGTVLAQLAGTALAIYMSWRFHIFQDSTKAAWNTVTLQPPAFLAELFPSLTLKPQQIAIYSFSYGMIWTLSAASLIGLIYLFLRLNILITTHIDPRILTYRAEYCSALILMGLLDLASKLDSSLAHRTSAHESVLIGRREWFDRKCVELSRIASGPWPRLMRRHYGIAGYEIASHANGIAFAFRRWQLQFIFIGTHIRDVNKSLQQALVDATEGNWKLLVPEEASDIKLTQGRFTRAAKRFFAITIPAGTALAIWTYFESLLGPLSQPIIVACLAFSALQLLLAIDPQAAERLDGVQKISDMFKRS